MARKGYSKDAMAPFLKSSCNGGRNKVRKGIRVTFNIPRSLQTDDTGLSAMNYVVLIMVRCIKIRVRIPLPRKS